MPYNEKLANRIREAIADAGVIEEKKMFRGMCFMLNGKMCVCVSREEMMCRIGPDIYEAALEKPGVRPMINNGRTIKGYVYVSAEGFGSKKDFDYWIKTSLAFNAAAKASKPKKTAKPQKKK